MATTSRVERIRQEEDETDTHELTLPTVLLQRAQDLEDQPALIDGQSGRAHTYEKLAEDVELIVERLAGRGFEMGDICVIHSPGLSEYIVASLAVATLGGTSILVNPRVRGEELTKQLNNADTHYLVTVPPYFESAMEAAEGTTVEEILVFGNAVGETEHENGMTVTPLC